MEARNRDLPEWFTRIRTRQIKLPRFQRYEAWDHQRVAGLLETVICELPAGSVLVLEVGDKEPFISRVMAGAPEDGERVTEHLLDGQQRLTALWRSLTDDYSNRTFFVWLEPDEESGQEYQIWSCARYLKDEKLYPLWIEKPQEVWKRDLIPLHLLRPDIDAEDDRTAWAKAAAEDDLEEVVQINNRISSIRQRFAKFNIPFLSLPSTTKPEIALDVFVKMNTSASPLTAYDIVVAQVEASVGQSLHDISDELSNSIPALKAYSEPSDLLLQVTALLQDKTATRSTFLSRDFGSRLIDTWPEAKKGISRAVTFLGEERIFDYQRLPTDVVLAPLATLWSLVPDGLDAEGEARLLLKKYLWRSFFTDRYERTSATRALADFRSLSALIKGVSTAAPLIFDDELHPLPDVEEFIVAGWPKRRDRLPRALLAAALNAGGIDFADGSPCTRESVLNREYHHLFPVAHLSDSWLDSAINRSLNCALITWKTNRSISAKSPAHYITDRMEASSIGETAVRQRLDSHLIPYDELMAGDYEAFLSARAELLHNRMKRLCEGIAIASD